MYKMGRNGVGNPGVHTDLPFLFHLAGGGGRGDIVTKMLEIGDHFIHQYFDVHHCLVLKMSPKAWSPSSPFYRGGP